jgi:hypothetical protein
MYNDTLGYLRRDHNGTDPLRGVVLEATNRKRSPGIDLAIREENVGRVHVPPAVNIVEATDVGFRGDRSLWESVQTILLDVLLAREL